MHSAKGQALIATAMLASVHSTSAQLNMTAITASNGSSTLQCWQFPNFTVSTTPGTQGSLELFLGEATNITYSAIAPRTNAGLHNAPAPQFVAFLSGIIQVSLPNRTDAGSVGWVVGGKFDIIYAEDTADLSRYGHITQYVSDESTIAIAIPVANRTGSPLGQHKVLRADGGCQTGDVVYI
ncbi:hypothetical protein EJ03DRAFT_322875 [Teratosphaeria nubilosa]|uniref:Small secreted protein n=1 Tax=Teratosphaeria nubilosa TaxID=161662 RepID=A0A6G1LP48_9PEZI|nr:hypothetical protein EJ03DRAFT_322875 [Teratosphaeria nubilosa]